MGLIVTIFTIFASILLIGMVIWIIVYPQLLKPVVHAFFYPHNEYQHNKNAVRDDKKHTTFYSSGKKAEHLIVIFIGGGGLYSIQNGTYGFANTLNELLKDDYDILLFDYPTRFKYTIKQSMLAINDILVDYIHYESIHAVGISFGCLLAGAFYHKESSKTKSIAMEIPQIGMNFKSLGLFSGTLSCNFNVDLVTKLFKFYIMRNTPSIVNYTCYGIQIPKFLVTSTTDFLIAQSMNFIQNEQCQYKIYKNKELPHAFSQFIHLAETIESINDYVKFIKAIDSV